MKNATKITLATAAALGIGLAATVHAFGPGYGYGAGYGPRGDCPRANTGYGRGMGMGPGAGMGRFNRQPGAGIDQRLAQVEPLLNLTDEQRPAWDQFKGALKARAGERQSHREQMFALRSADATLAERTEQRVALMSAHLEQLKTFADEAKKLDAVLTDEQRTTLAQYIGNGPRGGRGAGPGKGYGMGRGQGYGPGNGGRGW